MTGRLALDRLAGLVAVGGLDPYAAIESVSVRCIGAGGTTAIAHAVQARGLRLIVAEDQTAAARAECRETTGAMTLEELVAMLNGERDGEPLPHRTVAVKRRDPGTWRIGEDDLRAIYGTAALALLDESAHHSTPGRTQAGEVAGGSQGRTTGSKPCPAPLMRGRSDPCWPVEGPKGANRV